MKTELERRNLKRRLACLLVSLAALFSLTAFATYAAAADCPGNLRIIARTGQSVDGQTLTTTRPGVSINNRGTIAFAAFTSSGRGALLLDLHTAPARGGAGTGPQPTFRACRRSIPLQAIFAQIPYNNHPQFLL